MRLANITALPVLAFTALMGLSTAALAGPTYTFSTSVGTQPSNVGTITLTQVNANSVSVFADIINTAIPNSLFGYGFLNTGGPHTPFAFNLASESGLSISFGTPAGGAYTNPFNNSGTFSLNTAGGANTPYGTYGVAIDNSAGNGSNKAYYGDLVFTLSRTGGLSTDDFITNSDGYYFSADFTNGTNTGAQAWNTRSSSTTRITEVPEPLTLSLFGAGFAGIAAMRRRRKVA